MNPWKNLPRQKPFVLDDDAPYIEAFNSDKAQYSPTWIHTGRLPEPRLGPIDAPIIVLQKNPSYVQATRMEDMAAAEVADGLGALANEQSSHVCLARPNDWWDKTFNSLRTKYDRTRLSQRVLSIEYFPYPSAQFDHAALRLPSQQYTFSLVRAGLARGAIFVVTRGLDLWIGAVPELRAHFDKTVFRTKNRQRAFVTEGNLLGHRAYETICEQLEKAS